MGKTTIGITCTGSLIGQGVIKSIKKSDLADSVRMIGFEYFPGTVGSYWVDATHVMPDILKSDVSEHDYMGRLLNHIANHGIQFLFVGMGFELPLMAKYREHIHERTGCTVIVSPPGVIETAGDKYKTHVFLKGAGISCPETHLPGDTEGISYPVIVKPRSGTHSRGVCEVGSEEALRQRIAHGDDVIIQEKVGSEDTEYTCGILFLDGNVKTSICLRRYLKEGNTSVAIHAADEPPSLKMYVDDVAHKLQPFGPCNFQLRIAEDGILRLFEINARFSGTTYVRTLFGLNEVEYIIKYLLGLDLPRPCIRYGTVLRYQEEMFIGEGQ